MSRLVIPAFHAVYSSTDQYRNHSTIPLFPISAFILRRLARESARMAPFERPRVRTDGPGGPDVKQGARIA